MRKEWLGIVVLLLAACSEMSPQQQQQSAPVYRGPVEEISGVEPRYEPYNPRANNDYSLNGKKYSIVRETQDYSETGLAATYGDELQGNQTASGERFDANALAAAHPTLPIPSYVRVTNLNNGRRLVVRINDRGPYTPGKIIDLTTAAANRLNLTPYTKIKIDMINVAPDGSLSGPGTIGTTVAKQSFALPAQPDLTSSPLGTPVLASQPAASNANVRAIANPPADVQEEPENRPKTATQNINTAAPVVATGATAASISSSTVNGEHATSSGGFLTQPSALPAGVLESDAPVNTTSSHVASVHSGSASAAQGRYMVQVGALSNAERAHAWQQQLSQRFTVAGKVVPNGMMYRVQLGPVTKAQAEQLQQRLSHEAQQSSFILMASE